MKYTQVGDRIPTPMAATILQLVDETLNEQRGPQPWPDDQEPMTEDEMIGLLDRIEADIDKMIDGYTASVLETRRPLWSVHTATNPETTHIVVTGNPADGFNFYGPFDTGSDATTWADTDDDPEWWVVEMQAPGEDDDTCDGVIR